MEMRERIANLIVEKGIKGVELAEATSVNASTISRILKGTQMPTVDTLCKFAQYFGVTMEFLFTGQDTAAKDCTNAKFTQDERDLIGYYRRMNPFDQEDFLMIGEMKAEKEKKC